MAYYTLDDIKRYIGFETTNTDYDAVLTDFADKADDQVDNRLFNTASKRRRLSTLPELPLTTVPESIKFASNARAVAYYYARSQNTESHDLWIKNSDKSIDEYIERLESDAKIYGETF